LEHNGCFDYGAELAACFVKFVGKVDSGEVEDGVAELEGGVRLVG
jgi:hypothetical protein